MNDQLASLVGKADFLDDMLWMPLRNQFYSQIALNI
jgi:hypothetical protein